MRRNTTRSRAGRLLPILMAILFSTLLTGATLVPARAHAEPGVTISTHRIPGAEGVALDAKVIEPRGEGPFPVLVMPASWSMPNIEYVGAAAQMAYESGYVVVTYTARGFYASSGEIEVAGPKDVADASKVIDWALENTEADPAAVGMAGISYGAGISTLTAAADSRVRAISAMSGWSDLVASLYPNRTVSTQGAELLLGAGHLTGRFGPELSELERAYREGRVEDALGMAPERSAINKLDELNANGTAVMLANAWTDSLFPPQQMADLYQGLDGPKRLMLGPGDHATPELFGAAGLPNHIWESTKRWFDHHLRGVENGIDGESPVQIDPGNGGPWRGFADWESVTGTMDTRYLGAPQQDHSFAPATGSLAPEQQPEWKDEIRAGRPTVADSGTVLVNGALQGFFSIPTGVSVPLVDRRAAGVWATEPYERSVTVSGAPRLTTTVTPSAETTSLFAYLYDVDRHGAGSLITHKPVTLREATPGQPQQVDVELEPANWEVPAGHRLALVVDTVDPRYESAEASTVTFGSPEGAASTLEIPLS